MHPPLEQLLMTVGPGENEGRDEMRAALARLRGAAPPQLVLDAGHGGGKILGGASPAGGEQARRAVEGLDAEAGIVGEAPAARPPRRPHGP